jgi:hypothetical protein
MSAQHAHDDGCVPQPLETANRAWSWGIESIWLKGGEKDPNRPKWQVQVYTPSSFESVFLPSRNIGVKLGPRSGNLFDIDLDTQEAIRAGRRLLPPTGLMWGRKSKPRAHYLYRAAPGDLPTKNMAWKDPSPGNFTATLVELRWNGQTIAPGSVNTASGHDEAVRYEPDGEDEPATVNTTPVIAAVDSIAAVALLARYWNEGGRHGLALPLAGLCWYGGMSQEHAEELMADVCAAAGDDELENRLGCVRDTYRNGGNGSNISGGKTLMEDHGYTTAQVRSLRKWLNLKAGERSGLNGPDGFPLSGDGDGDRFADMRPNKVLYCAVDNLWYIWNGQVFEVDLKDHIREMAKQVVYTSSVPTWASAIRSVAGMASRRTSTRATPATNPQQTPPHMVSGSRSSGCPTPSAASSCSPAPGWSSAASPGPRASAAWHATTSGCLRPWRACTSSPSPASCSIA